MRESRDSDRFLVNTQVQSHALLRRGFGTSVPFIGLGTRLLVRMRTTLGTGVTKMAINTLNGCKVQRCDKHHFRDKMTVRT